jgi:hypothetical protein
MYQTVCNTNAIYTVRIIDISRGALLRWIWEAKWQPGFAENDEVEGAMQELGTEHRTHTVEITIDRHHYCSPEHTTGAALYILGNVKPNYDLFLEVKHGDDEFIKNDATTYVLKEHEVFHSVPSTLNPGA